MASRGSEAFVQSHQRRALERPDGGVIDERRFAGAAKQRFIDPAREVQRRACRRNVDVQRVQKETADRRVGAGGVRIGQVQLVKRVESDDARTASGGIRGKTRQVAEVADAPVRRRTQRVELQRKAPRAPQLYS